MILKQEKEYQVSFRLHPAWIWGSMALLAVLVGIILWQRLAAGDTGTTIYCGAEQTERIEGEELFVNGGNRFRNGRSRSTAESRNGNAASLVTAESPFGMNYVVEAVDGGEFFELSVWRKREGQATGVLVASLEGKNPIYRESKVATQLVDGWEKLELFLKVPENKKGSPLKLYVYANEFGPDGKVYFDDLVIQQRNLNTRLSQASRNDTAFETLELLVPPAGMLKLEAKAKEARGQGILVTTDDSWVKGKIVQPNNKIPVSLRLKGDWTDHLTTENWSFRVKTRLPETWNRFHTFSVQRPETRYFLHEWVFHELLAREGILTTRYDFIHFRLNGDHKGVYAYEEHFEKILVEAQDRREGPIVKLDETGLWNARKRYSANRGIMEVERNVHAYEAAKVLPFKEDQITQDSALMEKFLQAQTLLEQFQYDGKSSSEVFDAKLMGRYYALIDLTEAYHNLIWHNLRFYFNPVSVRLEPIGFDGFTEAGKAPYTHLPFMGSMGDRAEASFQDRMHPKVFSDPLLARYYIEALYEFSEPKYWEIFLQEQDLALANREKLLQVDRPDYRYDREIIRQRARQIRAVMFPVAESAIKAYWDASSQQIQVRNFHLLPLEIVGAGKKTALQDSLAQAVLLGPYDRGAVPLFTRIPFSTQPKYVYYRLPGLPTLYRTRVLPWPGTSVPTPPQRLFAAVNIETNELYTVRGKEILFQKGKLTVSEDILIPKGYQVRFVGGTELALTQGAAFISYSPVFMEGSEAEPILVHSPDQSGQGFTVLQTEARSQLRYVRFEHLNTLLRPGWTLTGAVTFYESDVEIRQCAFLNNHCEDALNTVRSEFLFSQSLVANTAFDGFDADFCRGTIEEGRFVNTGNDGMDFSGSRIQIVSAKVENAGDKGISVGEAADIRVEQLSIDGAVIGLASKDLSELRIEQLDVRNCQIGFAAYQKKPEFGGAMIWVRQYEATNNGRLHQIEQGSRLTLAGTQVKPI